MHRSFFFPALISAAACTLACGADVDTGDDVAVDLLAARWTEARAGFLDRCVKPTSLAGPFGRVAEPTAAKLASARVTPNERTAIDEDFRGRVVAAGRAFDRAAFEQCLASEGASRCAGDPDVFLATACAHVFSPQCTVPAASTARVGAFVGDACDDACGFGPYPSLACADHVCVTRTVVAPGDACDLDPRGARYCVDQLAGNACVNDEINGDNPIGTCVDFGLAAGAQPFVPGAEVVSAAVTGAGATTPAVCP